VQAVLSIGVLNQVHYTLQIFTHLDEATLAKYFGDFGGMKLFGGASTKQVLEIVGVTDLERRE